MARLGRSIRIYLAGGEVSGLRHAELANWTGQAILCPRSRISELQEWHSVVKKPGVYFLIGSEEPSKRDVYIGESEVVIERLQQHLEKDFWQEAVLVTSKDEQLTKSHIKFLEARLVTAAAAAARYKVINNTLPTKSNLPRADADAMEEFLSNLRLLLGALGHRILDPLVSKMGSAPSHEASSLLFSVRTASARGLLTDDGFVVLKGSTALPAVFKSMGSYQSLRDQLIEAGKLAKTGDLLTFVEDTLFLSPSAAAAVVSGAATNGRVAWKRADGRTLKEIELETATRGEAVE